MPNINDAFPSNYLKASDLQGHQAVVTVDRVEFEAVGRDREMKAVLYFVGKTKGVVLNKTNARKITEIVGSALTEDWQGTAIVLFPTETEFGHERRRRRRRVAAQSVQTVIVMAHNPEWFDQWRARGFCYICRRPMADDDPRRRHAECARAAASRRWAAIRLDPPVLRSLKMKTAQRVTAEPHHRPA